MRVVVSLTGAHLYQDAIGRADIGERLSVTPRLDKPGHWCVISEGGEQLGLLNAASPVARRLNAGEQLVEATLLRIGQASEIKPNRLLGAAFVFAEP